MSTMLPWGVPDNTGREQAAGAPAGAKAGAAGPKTGRKQAGRAKRATAPAGRRRGGQFAPGASGNPAGRPKGSRNKLTAACFDLLAGDGEAIISKAIALAKKGDGVALRLCIERLLPARASRDRTVELELPQVAKAADLVAAAGAIIGRAAAGEITISEAKEFMGLLEGQRKVIETAELAIRLEVLERSIEPKGGPVGFAAPADPDMAARVRRLE